MEWSHALPDVVGEGAALRRRRRREWRAPAARKGEVFLVGGRPPAVSHSVAVEMGGVVLIYRLPLPSLLACWLSVSSGPGRYGPILPLLRPPFGLDFRRLEYCLLGWLARLLGLAVVSCDGNGRRTGGGGAGTDATSATSTWRRRMIWPWRCPPSALHRFG
jgi:hypothetical protein